MNYIKFLPYNILNFLLFVFKYRKVKSKYKIGDETNKGVITRIILPKLRWDNGELQIQTKVLYNFNGYRFVYTEKDFIVLSQTNWKKISERSYK